MRPILFSLLCAFAGFVSERPAHATVLFNQTPNLNQFDIVDDRLADDFTLSQTDFLDGINFWYQANFETDLSTVAYAIYQNSGGSLGTVVTSGTATPSTSDQTDYFFASFTFPNVTLAAGTYWLELHAGTNLSDTSGLTVWWEASGDNATRIAQYSASGVPNTPVDLSGYNQYAFQLVGDPVPEPGSLLLIGAGLILVSLLGNPKDRSAIFRRSRETICRHDSRSLRRLQ